MNREMSFIDSLFGRYAFRVTRSNKESTRAQVQPISCFDPVTSGLIRRVRPTRETSHLRHWFARKTVCSGEPTPRRAETCVRKLAIQIRMPSMDSLNKSICMLRHAKTRFQHASSMQLIAFDAEKSSSSEAMPITVLHLCRFVGRSSFDFR